MTRRSVMTSAAHPVSIGAVALLTLSGCAAGGSEQADQADTTHQGTAEHGETLTIDNCGHEVTFEAVPERVILLESAPVTILEGLGVFDRVESRAGSFPEEYYDDELAQKVDDVEAFSDELDASGHLMISQEEVVAQSPDLVLGLPDGVTREGMAAAGAAVVTQELYCQGRSGEASFDDIYAEIDRYGEIFDRCREAEDLNAELSERVSAVADETADEDRSAAVVYPSAGGGPLYVYGTGSMAHPQLTAAGFDNVFSDTDERVFEVQTEELIDRDPDALIVLYQGDQQHAEEALMQRSGIEGVQAVSEGEVAYQLFNFTEPASPLVVDGLERIAAHFGAEEEG